MSPSREVTHSASLLMPWRMGTNIRLRLRNLTGVDIATTPANFEGLSAARLKASAPPVEKPMTQTFSVKASIISYPRRTEACQSCHQAEFDIWQASPHGHAVQTLETAGKSEDVDCLTCHTTAFGKPGGFPETAKVEDQRDLARVGCESCHGPGGEHIGISAKRVGTILSLGDKCDSCVILKVCGSCHDQANDPGFQFKVEERIDAQRHGSFEPAAMRQNETADRARLREAFATLANQSPVFATDAS